MKKLLVFVLLIISCYFFSIDDVKADSASLIISLYDVVVTNPNGAQSQDYGREQVTFEYGSTLTVFGSYECGSVVCGEKRVYVEYNGKTYSLLGKDVAVANQDYPLSNATKLANVKKALVLGNEKIYKGPSTLFEEVGIIPRDTEITYQYKLMFEARTISLWAYTLETVLAEKLEAILSRALTNTRLRDFYDLYILQRSDLPIDTDILSAAIKATSRKRSSEAAIADYDRVLDDLNESSVMRELWIKYQEKYNYAMGISWEDVLAATRRLCAIGIT